MCILAGGGAGGAGVAGNFAAEVFFLRKADCERSISASLNRKNTKREQRLIRSNLPRVDFLYCWRLPQTPAHPEPELLLPFSRLHVVMTV